MYSNLYQIIKDYFLCRLLPFICLCSLALGLFYRKDLGDNAQGGKITSLVYYRNLIPIVKKNIFNNLPTNKEILCLVY
jgi:hypothetical protein